MKLIVSKHPSGGFILKIPIIHTEVIKLFSNFKVWENDSSGKFHVELEFAKLPFDDDYDFFQMWVKQTALAGRVASEDNLIIQVM